MIVSLLVFVVILALSIPSAVIFIPLAALTGDVRPLYTAVCFIVRTGYFVAGLASSWLTTCRILTRRP
jgi:hypothetical protein